MILPIKCFDVDYLTSMMVSPKMKSIKSILNSEIFFHKFSFLYIAVVRDLFIFLLWIFAPRIFITQKILI